MFKKIPPEFHDKTVQSNILWLNLKKINKISFFFFYNQHINKVTPHFTFLRRAQNAEDHAFKQHRLSPNSSPVCSSFVLVIPSFHFHAPGSKRWHQCTQNSIGSPKIIPLPAPVLYWLLHLTCILSLKAKNERKTLIFTQLKYYPDISKIFPLFLDEF